MLCIKKDLPSISPLSIYTPIYSIFSYLQLQLFRHDSLLESELVLNWHHVPEYRSLDNRLQVNINWGGERQMITRPFSSESSPIAESSSNFDNKNVDGKKYIAQHGANSYSAETKSLAERSAIQTKKITQFELRELILQQIFSNDVHYQVEDNLSLDGCTDLTALPKNLSVKWRDFFLLTVARPDGPAREPLGGGRTFS